MKIGCLQFSPHLGDVDKNLSRADAVLLTANPDDLDLLVLPELAFSGYNFDSLHAIAPFLEPSGSGISSLWARTAALKFNCHVVVGYPEKVEVAPRHWPASPEYYNSAIVVNPDGETVANYRKSHLYYTDETWALESPEGFYETFIPCLGHTSIGICMDINPYRFESAWDAFEFGNHILLSQSNLVIVSMAWLTNKDRDRFSSIPQEPDLETLTYWATRLEPVIRAESDQEVIVVFCNRCGTEGDAVYAGTSTVIGIRDGEVCVYGLLGRGEKELLVVDTEKPPLAKMVLSPSSDEDLLPILLYPPAHELSIAEVLHDLNLAERKSDKLHTPSPAPSPDYAVPTAAASHNPILPSAPPTFPPNAPLPALPFSPDLHAAMPRNDKPAPPRLRIPETKERKVWRKDEKGIYQDESQSGSRPIMAPMSAPVRSASSLASANDRNLSTWMAARPKHPVATAKANMDSAIDVSPAAFGLHAPTFSASHNISVSPSVSTPGPLGFRPSDSSVRSLSQHPRSKSRSAARHTARGLSVGNIAAEAEKFARFKDSPGRENGERYGMIDHYLVSLDDQHPRPSASECKTMDRSPRSPGSHMEPPDHILIAASPSVFQTVFPPIPPLDRRYRT